MKPSIAIDTLAGFEAITVQNSRLRAAIIPALGGRVWELEDRLRQRQWIWHRPVVPLRAVPVGTRYDDVWAGGWEELFPNDAECRFEGRDLPDHGEWWASRWNVDAVDSGQAAILRLTASLSTVKVLCMKEFRLGNDSPTLSVRYRIRSEEARPFHFLFKQHLPIAITPDCQLMLPGGSVSAVDADFGTLLTSRHATLWPSTGAVNSVADLREISPPIHKHREFVYVCDLPAGWCGVCDRGRAASIRMSFDLRKMPYVWLFLTYGGWRDLYTAVLEPCSNMPKDLAQATRLGQSARLEPGQEFTTEVSVTLGSLADVSA